MSHAFFFCRLPLSSGSISSYDGRDAYGIALGKVSNLDNPTKRGIRDFVRVETSPKRGLVSNPRPFLPDKKEEVIYLCIYI